MFTNVTLLYFLLLVPLSGFIAWLGDRIGHKSGKRRHSVFGLRPRHTAMLFTIGTGACISLVSFGVVWALSESFRIVVRDGASLVSKNHDLKQENSRLQLGNNSLRTETDTLQKQASASAADAARASETRDAAVKRAHDAGVKAQAAQAKVAEVEARLAQETQTLNQAQDILRQDNARLRQLGGELSESARDLAAARKQVSFAQKQVADAKARVVEANDTADTAVRNYGLARKRAAAELAAQQKNFEDLQTRLAAQTKLFDDKTRQIDEKSHEIDGLRKLQENLDLQVKAGHAELAKIEENIGELRGRSITYQVGEEVDRTQIAAGYNIWRVETMLGSFLNHASLKAQARGAGQSKMGFQRDVIILPKIIEGERPGDDTHVATEDDSIHAAATAIRSSNTDVVVIANATANAVDGEPVPVEFHIYRNPVVIPAETHIGEAAIDGNGTRQQIADSLAAFLSKNVRRSLLQAGIIPPSRGGEGAATSAAKPPPKSDGDSHPAGEISDESGGDLITLSGDEWLQIVDHIRDAGSHARIVAVAARDMRAGDSVSLRFEVKGFLGVRQSAVLSGDDGRQRGAGY